ncbi:MAG TPA: LacI family DNA-binding transcriptional regulator [Conexibacter sp.]|nr:LacI family DNA-binding transcriptional regulator [Conexibacter sp.]
MPKPRTSIKEVAQRAGVAVSSVSRVLSDHPDVSPEMRERVMAAVAETGYRPDMLAQSLRSRSTKLLGFVVGDISNPLLAEIALGAETALREAGYSMLLTNSNNDAELEAEHVAMLRQRRVDGMLLSLAAEDHPGTLAALADAEVPAVLIDRELAGPPDGVRLGAVLSDHRSGMRDAVAHLLELGHRRIGLILGQPMRFSRERLRGLEDAYAERDLPATHVVIEGRLGSEHGRAATAQLLDGADPVTAVVAGGNQLLIGALQEIRARGLRIGSELSLVSCDEVPLTELLEPPIAVVRRDTGELGLRATQMLLDAIAHETVPETVVLPTEFVPRPSCAPPPVTAA